MKPGTRAVRNIFFAVIGIAPVSGYAAPGVLADQPLYLAGGRGVPGNLVLTPSVEYPTVQSLANLGDYSQNATFEGYFDPNKCYVYSYSSEAAERYFRPSSISNDRSCTGANEWSGNFLNWSVTQTIDPFRKVLTGGYRVKDTASETWLEKARHPGQSGLSVRTLNGASAVAAATPFSADSIRVRIQGLGVRMRFSVGGTDVNVSPIAYDPSTEFDSAKSHNAHVRVKVCDPSVGLEANCVQYSNSWKPEGLIQKNASSLRYSVFGYLNDDSSSRDGGVLRAKQKFVGPNQFTPENGASTNPNAEWDATTGVLKTNPDSTDASNTPGTVTNSGVINYINKFGQLNDNDHKSLDPVSELYYAATRYLKGQGNVSTYSNLSGLTSEQQNKLNDGFPVITNWDDPVQYECQPAAILGIGDANTHDDKNLPGNTAYRNDEPAMPSAVSSDQTVDVVTMTNRVGNIEGIDDTLGQTNSFTGRDNSAYIAGLAYDNHVNDMRTDADMDGMQTASTHWVDVLENGVMEPPADNQYYLAAKYGGFDIPDDFEPSTRTEALPEAWWHTNGETVTVGSTSFKRPDNYYIAGQADKMIASLEKAFENIVAEAVGSSTGVTFNTATLETDTLLFGARFDSANWTGELFATALSESASGPPSIADSETWEAGNVLDNRNLLANARDIVTYNGTTGMAFTWANWASLTTRQQNDLKYDGGTGDLDLAKDRVSYLRGEEIVGLRSRASLLGDIINSTPVYVSSPDLGWPTGAPFGIAGNTYPDFRAEQDSRASVVYVGSNDGMLHAFSGANGSELFGYIPEFIFSNVADEGLHYLTQQAYQHRYYVDLTPVVSDVYTQGAGSTTEDWRTVLIGGARTGGKGIFALDITSPGAFSEANASSLVMWEFSSQDDPRMGYIIEPPTVGLVKWGNNDYRWTAFVPNGYNSSSTVTGLFMLDIEGGLDGVWSVNTDYRFVEFDASADASGLSPVRQIDLNGDRIIDRIYAGDLKGNIWVAEGASNGGWSSAYSGGGSAVPLFTATDTNANAQPITAAPMVVRNPLGDSTNTDPDVMVLFGTGQYLTQDDTASEDLQSFYGVIDSGLSSLDRDDLVSRSLSDTTVAIEGVSYDVRTSTGDDFDTQSGWFVDFTTETGERIVQAPQVRGEYVFVNSTIPSSNPCDVGGSGWLMAFGLDGLTPDRAVWPKLGAPYVGFKTEGGLPNRSSFLGDYALIPRSDSEILNEEIDVGGQPDSTGRMSWQELYD
nr:PilC/PilY family type IV pilus protein [uncultured Marinobacter sp.]